MRLIFIAFASLVGAGALQAQTNQSSVGAPVSSDSHQSAPSCELHIYPTKYFINSSLDFRLAQYGYGGPPITGPGEALTAAQRSGSGALIAPGLEQMQTMLSPQIQIEALKNAGVISLLKLPSDTAIVVEEPIPLEDQIKNDPAAKSYVEKIGTAMRHNVAVSASAPTCYRELYITTISLQKNLGSLKFSAAFLYRTFDKDHCETHLFDGQRTIPKPEHFPATSADQMQQASTDARAAFTQAFEDWVAHRVKL